MNDIIYNLRDPLIYGLFKYLSLRDFLNCMQIKFFNSILDCDKFWDKRINIDFINVLSDPIRKFFIISNIQSKKDIYKICYNTYMIFKHGISYRLSSKGNTEHKSIFSFEELYNLEKFEVTGYVNTYNLKYERCNTVLYNLVNLKQLTIENVRLLDIPSSIGNLKNLNEFELCWCENITFPDEFWGLTNLTSLKLFATQLGKLPDGIANLTNLETLNIDHNGLIDITPITNLKKLKHLSMLCNKLTIIPEEFNSLINLEYLNIMHNEIVDILPICSSTKLNHLDVGQNKIKNLPNSFNNLKSLNKLHMNTNKLKSFKNLCGCENLEMLFLDNNEIKSVPKEIMKLDKLKKIFLYGNHITKITKEWIIKGKNFELIPKLDFRNNKITDLTPLMKYSKHLSDIKEINLINNPIEQDWNLPVGFKKYVKAKLIF